MDLWIRSSQKTNLLKCSCLSLKEGKDVYDNKKMYEYDKFIICQCWDNGNITPLGTYKSKERALEVLDEIQNFIQNDCQEFITTNENKEEIYCCYKNVYEMPKE